MTIEEAYLMRILLFLKEDAGLKEEDVLLVMMELDTNEKKLLFNKWLRPRMKGNKFEVTKKEVLMAAYHIRKGDFVL